MMRAGAFVLPDPFPHRNGQFRVRAATGPDSKRARVAFLRTASPHRGALAECQAESAHTLFAKIEGHDQTTSRSITHTVEPAKILAPAHTTPLRRVAYQARAQVACALPFGWLAMLLSELAIIYLATAAPFGVARFLGEHASGTRKLPALLKAAGASLAWPFTSLTLLLKRACSRSDTERVSDEGGAPDEQRVEQVKRVAVNALRSVEELLADACELRSGVERHTLYAARESIERYAGLALACTSAACAPARADARPSPRELELCRIAGRAGDDLLVAGLCVHRRNITRLFAHRERASSELVHALAAVREVAHNLYPAPIPSQSVEQTCDENVRRVSEALLRALSHAIELLSLFDDRATTNGVARLLDAERARLRRVEFHTSAETRAGAQQGEDSCTTQAVPTAFATPRLRTTTSHGG
jgi:hypothetical protein